eukprot:3868429-Alexandrium_andersonii.AAC.1
MGHQPIDVTADVLAAGAQIPAASRRVEFGPQPAYMDDQAVFQIDLGDREQFRREVFDWATYWRPGAQAIAYVQRVHLSVLRVVLSRPSGWGEVGSVSRA